MPEHEVSSSFMSSNWTAFNHGLGGRDVCTGGCRVATGVVVGERDSERIPSYGLAKDLYDSGW
jgi:hypothetical protein